MTPCHSRTLQTLAEHDLASRLRHAAADRHPLTPILRVLHPHRMLAQVTVGFPVIRLPLAELATVIVVPHRRSQHLGHSLMPVTQPAPPFGKPLGRLGSFAKQS